MHSKLGEHSVSKKELTNSIFKSMKKNAQVYFINFHSFSTERHLYNRGHANTSTKPSKILDFPNMTRLWEVITFLLGRAEKKKAPSLRIYGPRSFDWRYFQLHRSTPSTRKSSPNIFYFRNFRNPRCVRPYHYFRFN